MYVPVLTPRLQLAFPSILERGIILTLPSEQIGILCSWSHSASAAPDAIFDSDDTPSSYQSTTHCPLDGADKGLSI